MLSQVLRRTATVRSTLSFQTRGKAVQNWKRPTMEEYLAPKEPWQRVNAKNQTRYNMSLLGGTAFLGVTLAFANAKSLIELHSTPKGRYETGFVTKLNAAPTTEPAAKPSLVAHKKKVDIPEHVPYLLIGAGTASFAAYRAIKSRDVKAKILIVGEEPRLPYMRPPLSKELWFADKTRPIDDRDLKFKQWNGRERSLYYEPHQFYADPAELADKANGGIALLSGHKVVRIDATKQVAYLEDGRKISYDKCLIATGGRPKLLPVLEGIEKQHVTLYRTVDDFFKLDALTKKFKSITIVGGGFLGSELACALGERGQANKQFSVTQLFPEKGNMAKVLPEYLSQWTTEKVKSEGVTVLPNTRLTSAKQANGKVILTTDSGQQIVTDHVVCAVGIETETRLANESGLEVDNTLGGYLVNAELEARTNLWVAGDAACFYDTMLGRRRVEHHDHAVVSGRLAGENMVGGRSPYTHQSMFWSDLGPEVGYEAIGKVESKLPTVGVFAKATPTDTPRAAAKSDQTMTRSDDDDDKIEEKSLRTLSESGGDKDDFGKGVVFYLQDNVVVGIVLWNVFNKMRTARQVIREHKKYDDLSEVAKLFNIHGKQDEAPPEE